MCGEEGASGLHVKKARCARIGRDDFTARLQRGSVGKRFFAYTTYERAYGNGETNGSSG